MLKIKQVEITNFKSYKSTRIIPIDAQFTCIIGTNGSGKSNILDAIVFCLHPSSKSIRVDNVKFLISEGNFCNVKVFLCEEDDSTLEFSRHLNINGKSTYFYNTKKVSFEDYNYNLYNLGINNFIIYQSSMDFNIVNIIEELSGSSKLKQEYSENYLQYKSIMQKVKSENENKKQFENLLKENEKCEEHKKLMSKLTSRKKELEEIIFNININNLLIKYNNININQINNFDYDKYNKIRDDFNYLEIEYNKNILHKKHNLNFEESIEEKLDKIKNIDEEISHLNYNYKEIENFDNLEKTYLSEIENSMDYNFEINNTFDRVEKYEEKLQNMKNDKKNLENLHSKKIVEFKNLEQDEIEFTKNLNKINNEILLNKNIKMNTITLASIKNKLRNFKGVKGFIKDLITCKNKKYEISINSLLSKYEYGIIVEDENAAIECIKYCKENKLGRITCFIKTVFTYEITKCKVKESVDVSLLQISPIVVCEFPKDISNVVNFLFKNTLITENIDTAYKLDTKYNICTLDGIIIKNKGRIINYNKPILQDFNTNLILEKRLFYIDKLSELKNNKLKYSNVEIINNKINKLNESIQEYTKIIYNIKLQNKKNDTIKIIENKVFKDLFIKNGYLNYNDYINKNSKCYKEESILKIKILESKKQKLLSEIKDLKNLIKNTENFNMENYEEIKKNYKNINQEKKDFENMLESRNNLIHEKEKIYEEIKDLYFIEKNQIIDNLDSIKIIEYCNEEELKIELKEINYKLNNCSLFIKNTINFNYKIEDYENLKKEALAIKQKFNIVKNKRVKLFNDCFNLINEHINNLYVKFMDGTCNLVAENKEEPYLGSIKHYVLVPNKKYMEYENLSGGEQMISKIIFMYAVYHFKKLKIKFILLDEVDSNLDNYNVKKLVEFIKSENLQVVMVSLKIGVYKCCDEMIGVYKREGGSNLLYYRFK